MTFKLKIFSVLISFTMIQSIFYSCSNEDSENDIDNSVVYQCQAMPVVQSAAPLASYGYSLNYSAASNLKVYNRNLYLGADVQNLLMASDLTQIITLVDSLYTDIINNEFVTRAAGIAREISELQPDVIVLQEAELIRTEQPSDFLTNYSSDATCEEIDFITTLTDALSAHSLTYHIAVKKENADIEITDMGKDIRITDYDVILVKDGFNYYGEISSDFTDQFSVDFGALYTGFPVVNVTRSYSSIMVEKPGVLDVPVRIVNTHLEMADSVIRQNQAAELAGFINSRNENIILAADLNSDPLITIPPYPYDISFAYQTLAVDSSLFDAFTVSSNEQNTCCLDILTDAAEIPEVRIDHILYKTNGSNTISVEGTMVTGIDPLEMISSSDNSYLLWPSDHAGLAAGFIIQ
ncbi:MAG: endonuclease/exonuclease/phosphatase family protein [Spirochaetia bacterium]|nr:endonuclease/exonuclease/phosphatase family protein [Spirochaetia bacterium]